MKIKITYVSAHGRDAQGFVDESDLLIKNVKASRGVKASGKFHFEICSVWTLSPSYGRSHIWNIFAERAHLLRVLKNCHNIFLLTSNKLHGRLHDGLGLVQSSGITVFAYELFSKHKFGTFKCINPYELFQTFKIASI